MYAVYCYKAGSTTSQVISDIVLIATGTTNVGSLSASCVQANTSIVSTVAAGWSVWDASAATNGQVLRAVNADGTTYKYFGLTLTSTSAISFTACESWNASTHTPTNYQTQSSTWDATNGGYFYIYATPRNIIISPWTTTGTKDIICTFEFSRDSIPAGYPCHALTHSQVGYASYAYTYLCRQKNVASTGDTTNVYCQVGPIKTENTQSNGYNSIFQYNHVWRDASENAQITLYRAGLTNYALHLGTAYDIFITSSAIGNALDEITVSGTTYVLIKTAGNAFLVPKA